MRRLLLIVLLVVASIGQGTLTAGAQEPEGHPGPSRTRDDGAVHRPASSGRSVGEAQRRGLLGDVRGDDRAWTTFGDLDGLHVLTATAGDGYTWREAATLVEPGFEGETWIGHGCLVADQRTAVVTYAPRRFTNRPEYFARGGFVASVDLVTGTVKKLRVTSSLAYFTPSCGQGDDAAITLDGGEKFDETLLVRVHAGTGQVDAPVKVAGHVTSAVPTEDGGFVAAGAGGLLAVDGRGTVKPLLPTSGVAFDLAVDQASRLVYLDRSKDVSVAHRIERSGPSWFATSSPRALTLARGPLQRSGAARAAGGRVVLLGEWRADGALPSDVGLEPTAAKDAEPSTSGALLVASAQPAGETADKETGRRLVQVDAVAAASDQAVNLSVAPGGLGNVAADPSPVLRVAASVPQGSRTNPVESERTCSVPRNDPKNQAMQPKPRQVEWAVDQAVRGTLTVQRPANWKNLGMPAYTPQGLFPSKPLSGGGNVPAQVFLGVLAQESNLWQAPGNVTPGVTGNPLIGNYYGLQIYDDNTADDWNVNFDLADCGYGVSQVTDGMRLAGMQKPGETPFAYQTQRAVALDYAANVAAGLRILQDKWNQVAAAGLTVNNGDPKFMENWFYAVWAYNTGFHPKSEAAANNGAWGLGWSNNPANPAYKPNRSPFMEDSYADASHPEDWPYPEKVMGWAGHPVEILESPDTYVAGYRAAWWAGLTADDAAKHRRAVKPPVNQFCDSSNQCFPGARYTGTASEVYGADAGPCAHRNAALEYDLKCWYHQSTRWKSDCPSDCGYELLRFSPGYAYQDDGVAYPPSCTTSGLPAGALVVDDQSDSYVPVRPGCSRSFTNQGSFGLTFGNDSGGYYPSKTDFQQLGAGFNGHFWYAHTRTKDVRNDSMRVTGTWTLNKSLNQWARVLVHLPDIGAQTQEAAYTVSLGSSSRTRVILQRRRTNAWVSLGVFPFAGTPKVTLSSTNHEGDGPKQDQFRNEDVAFDAVAFQPLSSKPKDVVVSLGDSYSSGEGSSATSGSDFYPETDSAGSSPSTANLCHRSRLAWSRKAQLAGTSASIGALSDSWSTSVEHDLLACSGAESENVLPSWTAQPSPPLNAQKDPNVGLWREVPQLDRGFVDQDTTLVTMSIGGNDARFATVLAHCITQLAVPCQTTALDKSSVPASSEVPGLINGPVFASVKVVLARIHAQAPKAKIVLMGYPRVIEPGLECADAPFVSADESIWMGTMADLLDDKLKKAAADSNTAMGGTFVYFGDPRTDFKGHGVCSGAPGIRGASLTPTPAEDILTLVSQQSFHPNAAGQQYYANALNRTLRQLGR